MKSVADEEAKGKALASLDSSASSRSWFSLAHWFGSNTFNMDKLEEVERKVLSSVWDKIESSFVEIFNGTRLIRTISMNTASRSTPLVLVHGMGAGVGFWVLNLPSIAKSRPVYAMDVMGFGRSSRPKFSPDAMLSEMEFVESIEDWRKQMKLDKFILLGHSLGGFLASSYAIRYPDRIRHLILVDPWGFPEVPLETDGRTPRPLWIKAVIGILQHFNPLSVLRVVGPIGPSLIAAFRKDLTGNFSPVVDKQTLAEYVFYCNSQPPSGEMGFKYMTEKFGWAKFPMINRMKEIPSFVPMTIMYGSRSWVDSGIGWQIKYLRSDSYVDVQVVRGAGHHVYADRADLFNLLVNTTCNRVDQQIDLKSAQLTRRRMRSESSPALHNYTSASGASAQGQTPEAKTMPKLEESDVGEGASGEAEAVKFILAEEDEEEEEEDGKASS